MTVDAVLKIGGGVFAQHDVFDHVLAAITSAARSHRLVIVPGGGPFADTVRDVDRRAGLSDTAAHWMAILAMDQYSWLLASRLDGSLIVDEPEEVGEALAAGKLPVLAPSRWLRAADPLPHSWDVTSDSIAAWVAAQLGTRRLILIKPAGAAGSLVDPYFSQAAAAGVDVTIVPADQIDSLAASLGSTALSS